MLVIKKKLLFWEKTKYEVMEVERNNSWLGDFKTTTGHSQPSVRPPPQADGEPPVAGGNRAAALPAPHLGAKSTQPDIQLINLSRYQGFYTNAHSTALI